MKRMSRVLTLIYSWSGCLRPPCGGTLTLVPSSSLSSPCCTPSPLTSRDAWVVGLARYLVDFVDKDNASFSVGYVVVGHLQESGENAFHVFAHVSGLGEYCGVDNGERHVKQLGYGACHECFACACGAHHDDVALLYLYAIGLGVGILLRQALVVVVDGNAQVALGIVLPDDVLVEMLLDLFRFGYVALLLVCCVVGAVLVAVAALLWQHAR